MTTTFAVNANNDLYLDVEGNIAIVTGLEATLQACQQAVQTVLGSMVLDTQSGIPYFDVVFNGSPNVKVFQVAATTAILDVADVIQVLNFTVQIANKVLSYQATIETDYGIGGINGGL